VEHRETLSSTTHPVLVSIAMGAEVGKPVSNLGITAMASVTPAIEQKELTALRTELLKIATAKGSEAIVKAELDDALKKSGKFDAADLDIFAKLFTLFDTGDETVNVRDYFCGVAGCLLSLKLVDRLQFVLATFDMDQSNSIMKPNLKRVLLSINSVASYFGDPVLSLKDVEQITNEVYESVTGATSKVMPIPATVEALLKHPLVEVFLAGEGKVRFGSSELNPPPV
jgi:Ca2+-binding EF-hand superfamily protein